MLPVHTCAYAYSVDFVLVTILAMTVLDATLTA